MLEALSTCRSRLFRRRRCLRPSFSFDILFLGSKQCSACFPSYSVPAARTHIPCHSHLFTSIIGRRVQRPSYPCSAIEVPLLHLLRAFVPLSNLLLIYSIALSALAFTKQKCHFGLLSDLSIVLIREVRMPFWLWLALLALGVPYVRWHFFFAVWVLPLVCLGSWDFSGVLWLDWFRQIPLPLFPFLVLGRGYWNNAYLAGLLYVSASFGIFCCPLRFNSARPLVYYALPIDLITPHSFLAQPVPVLNPRYK
jgi:hypothetical protein